MKIRIVGAGLAGSALAHFARPHHEVRLYANGPSASAMGYGLLHLYGGARAKLNRFGNEGLAASLALIPPHAIVKKGLIRVTDDPDRPPIPEAVRERNPGLAPILAFYTEDAYVIDMEKYLSHLSEGLEIHSQLEEWGDITIWATGAHHPAVKKVKGQKLKIRIKDHGLTDPISGPCYIIPLKDQLIVGATYERDVLDWAVDLPKAQAILFPKLKGLLPHFDENKIESIEGFAGLRATTPDHLPLVKQLDEHNWLLTGLGSKGLLYHALYAERLIHSISTRL